MEWVLAIFLFVLGACLGSFLNVVIYRVPQGQSVAFPMRSFCPRCGRTIRGHDNLPILSWLLLRGRCRDCGAEIAPRYLLVELAGGLLTAGLFLAYFVFDLRGAAGPFETAWPMYAAHAALLLGLLASAVIDAEHFIIPIEVMWLCAAGGFCAAVADPHPFLLAEAGVSPTLAAAAVGGLAGLGISAALVRWGYLQPSFLDAENPARMDRPVLEAGDGPLPASAETTPSAEAETGPPDPAEPAEAAEAAPEPAEPAGPIAGDAPATEDRGPAYTVAATSEWGVDPRREILREVVYLLPALLLAAGAVGLLHAWPAAAHSWDALFRPASLGGWALSTQAAAASLWGLLIGGAWVWGARIAGTLAFGKEAMGLGDVHLLAAVGAVTGWITPTLVFFIAPFCGLLWALTVWFVHKRRELPYGPWLAAATLIVLLLQDRLLAWILPARSASLP